MLPFVCSARCFRSTLRFSTKVVKRNFIARKQGKLARVVCVADLADGQWFNHKIQEESRTFVSTTSQYGLIDACSSILISTSGETLTPAEVVAGDDDEVTSTAGKKRKHWNTCADEG